MKKTRIVCTIGPATQSVEMLVKLVKNGMNLVRLNFSHGTWETQLEIMNHVHEAEKITGHTIGLIQDLQGPKIRLGKLPESGVKIAKNKEFFFSTAHNVYTEVQGLPCIPVQYKNLHKDIGKDDIVLVEDGLIKTEVLSIKGTLIRVRALTDSVLKSHKGLNVSTASISADPLTPKDLKDLKFGLKHDVDYVALSFVRRASDIIRLRKIIRNAGSAAKIIAKIERHEAIEHLEEIIKASDAIMVARGDLGVECPAEMVPIYQKRMVRMANTLAKPVIIATEMLQSMITQPRGTRAEISDAANGVFDHTDALMLSNETAVGKYPVEAVHTLAKVAANIESYQREQDFTRLHFQKDTGNGPEEICYNAALLAHEVKARYVIAITQCGYTAIQISKQRIFNEIIVITPSEKVKRELQLNWGINRVFISRITDINKSVDLIEKELSLKKGDRVVVVSNALAQNRQIALKQI